MASTFSKRERLSSQKLTEALFHGGGSRSLAAFPVRAVYMLQPRQQGDMPVQLLVSVPKKRFHHAVDRNRVKRQLREAFRLNKGLLAGAVPDDRQLLLAFVWLSDRHQASAGVHARVVNLLQRIAEKTCREHVAAHG